MAESDGGGVGRFLGVHPSIKVDPRGRLIYDSSDEPEEEGRDHVQPNAIAGGAHMQEAMSYMTDVPCREKRHGDGMDLLSPAPMDGDA